MTDPLILAAPLLILVISLLFLFVGCGEFGTTPGESGYADLVKNVTGFTAHWRLDDTTSNQAKVLGSLSPTADGTYRLEGVTLKQPGADPNNSAVVLDGAKGLVDVPYHALLNTADSFTIELWAKPNPASAAATQVLISSHDIDGTRQRGYDLAFLRVAGDPNTRVRARLFHNAAPAFELTVTPNVGPPDAWRHIVMVHDNTNPKDKKLIVYVGVKGTPDHFIERLNGIGGYNIAPKDSVTLRFGAGHDAATAAVDFFAGSLDEVAFYNAAMTQKEVIAHFDALKSL